MAKKKIKKTPKGKTPAPKSKGKVKILNAKSAREKMIGQHIGYRYDVNLLPDYKRLTPFLKKYTRLKPLLLNLKERQKVLALKLLEKK